MRKRGKQRRHVDPMAHARTIGRMVARQSQAPLCQADVIRMSAGCHEALDAVTKGQGDFDTVNCLVNAANVSMVLAEQGLGPECLPDIRHAQNAIAVMAARGQATGRYVFDGPGLVATRELLSIFDQQIEADVCTEGLLLAAVAELQRRIKVGDVVQVEKVTP